MDSQRMFTAEEWKTLKLAPLWVFCGVANADEVVEEIEMAALAKEVEEAELYDEPLVREVFQALKADGRILEAYEADDRDMDAGLAEVADILARKVPPAPAEVFKKALVFVGRVVAEASGDDPFSAARVSEEEELSLFRVADILGVEL